MEQTPIKLRQNQPNRFEIEEVDANWTELDVRTANNEEGYNSIAEIAGKVKDLETAGEATTIENEYLTIAPLLAGQVDQTPASLQYVEDASDDPEIVEGYAYYEKLATSTADLSDYRLLGQAEVDVILDGLQKVEDQNGNAFQAVLKVIYGQGFNAAQQPDGSYRLDLQSKTTADTGTSIDMGWPLGNECNMLAANTNSAFTLTNVKEGGEATVLINRATEPTVTGATKIPGHTFVVSTDMHLKVKCRQSGIVQYYFLKLT
ncbi:MAG: hypothetical protein JJE55_08305 [Flavobacteriaceae bacterium]|nr:hypothetical protein [Flavobacteriaceae bacterium]